MRDLKTELYFTARGHKTKSVQEIADNLGISANYLYRSTEEGESGCRFPLDLLIPLIQATGNLRVLDHLCARTGSVRVDLKNVSRLKKRDPESINRIQASFAKLMALVLGFYADPDQTALPAVRDAVYEHLSDVLAVRKSVENFRQGEMF